MKTKDNKQKLAEALGYIKLGDSVKDACQKVNLNINSYHGLKSKLKTKGIKLEPIMPGGGESTQNALTFFEAPQKTNAKRGPKPKAATNQGENVMLVIAPMARIRELIGLA